MLLNQGKRFILPLLVICLTILVAVVPDIVSEEMKAWCLETFGPAYPRYLIGLFILGSVILGVLSGDWGKGSSSSDKTKAVESAKSQLINQELRTYLKRRYERRLKQKLAERQPVNLRQFVSTEGTTEETSAIFVPYSGDEIQAEIGQIFKDAYGRLLIVGLPGAGKTTLLLQLAQSLLEAELDALPVVLNLATWQSSYINLKTWLEEIVPAELSTNKSAGKLIMQQSGLILLLDGLDEVKAENRATCLEAIGNFGADAKQRFVITCRIEEYKEVVKDAPVNLQIEVGPLTVRQLEVELERIGHRQPEALPLLQAIRKDELLRQAVQTPFYFNTLQILFAGRKTLNDLSFVSINVEGRQKEIIHGFLDHELSAYISIDTYQKNTKRWLSFLANRLNTWNIEIFELKNLQHYWLLKWTKNYIIKMWLIVGLRLGLVIVIVGGVGLFSIISILWEFKLALIWVGIGLFAALVLGFIFALMYILNFGMRSAPLIQTKDNVLWSWKSIVSSSSLKRELKFGLLYSILAALSFKKIFAVSLVAFFVPSILFYTFISENSTSIIQIKSPYQRFYASMKVLYFSILDHWLVRWELKKNNLLPLHLVDFLNEMSTCHILETDGATWRFRHKLIQDWFAENWEQEYPEEVQEEQKFKGPRFPTTEMPL